MASVTNALKGKVLRRVAPAVFVAVAGITLAACGSSGGSGNHNSTTTQHNSTTTTKPGSSGGAGF